MIYTKYGSRVEIDQSYKENRDLGLFLVRARVIATGPSSNPALEKVGQAVLETDTFHQGWTSNNDLVADGGPQEIVQACMGAPDGVPANVEQLMKTYWPTIFGRLEFVGGVATSSIGSRIASLASLPNATNQRRIA